MSTVEGQRIVFTTCAGTHDCTHEMCALAKRGRTIVTMRMCCKTVCNDVGRQLKVRMQLVACNSICNVRAAGKNAVVISTCRHY